MKNGRHRSIVTGVTVYINISEIWLFGRSVVTALLYLILRRFWMLRCGCCQLTTCGIDARCLLFELWWFACRTSLCNTYRCLLVWYIVAAHFNSLTWLYARRKSMARFLAWYRVAVILKGNVVTWVMMNYHWIPHVVGCSPCYCCQCTSSR